MKNRKSLTKTIFTTILILIFTTIALFAGCMLIFPSFSAKITKNLGMNGLTTRLYLYDYKNFHNINSAFNSINLAISCDDYKSIIDCYELLENDEHYDSAINQINESNYFAEDLDILAKSALINEDNYYKNKYILALNKQNNYAKALKYSNINTKTIENYKRTKNYLFSPIVHNSTAEQLLENNTSLDDKSILTIVVDYYNSCIELYNNIEVDYTIDKVYYLDFCRRILNVANDIVYIDSICQQELVNIDDVNNQITLINNQMLEVIK